MVMVGNATLRSLPRGYPQRATDTGPLLPTLTATAFANPTATDIPLRLAAPPIAPAPSPAPLHTKLHSNDDAF